MSLLRRIAIRWTAVPLLGATALADAALQSSAIAQALPATAGWERLALLPLIATTCAALLAITATTGRESWGVGEIASTWTLAVAMYVGFCAVRPIPVALALAAGHGLVIVGALRLATAARLATETCPVTAAGQGTTAAPRTHPQIRS